MTRNEAENILHKELWGGNGCELPEKWLRVFEALGMLKLDEPPTVRSRLSWVIAARPSCDPVNAATVLCWLEEAGLKAVEK